MISFKKLDKKQQQLILLGVLITCIILALYYQLLLLPMLSRLGKLLPQAKAAREEVLKTRDEMNRVNLLKRRVEELQDSLNQYHRAIPLESDLSQFLSYLSSEAKQSRITLVGVEPAQPEEPTTPSPFRTIRLRVKAKGGYHPLGIFLNRLENGDRFIGIDAFEISADPKTPMEHAILLYLRTYAAETK